MIDPSYIPGGMRIPRAHLAGGAAGGNESFDSESSSGSEYTIKEEVERRVCNTFETSSLSLLLS